MRELFIIAGILLCMGKGYAQEATAEKVNWEHPNMFMAKRLTFSTKKVKLSCRYCKCMELQTASGVTGLFIMGNGSFVIPGKKIIKDQFSACLIRVHPDDYKRLVKIVPGKKIKDAAYYAQSRDILKNMFLHSYHSDMNALLPPKNGYTVGFYAPKYGDIFAGYADDVSVVYDYTTRRKL